MMENEIKEKKSIGSKVVIVILSLLLLGACSYIAYDKLMVKENNNQTNKKKETIKSDKETLISDNLLINDLSEKITYLNTARIFTGYEKFNDALNKSIEIDSYNFRNIYDKQLSDDDKLDITLNSLEKNYVNLSVPYENMSDEVKAFFKPYVETGSINDIAEKQISSVHVENRYQLLFGEKVNNHSIKLCPFFTYDSKNNVYYYSRQCGGTGDGSVYLYKNKFTTKDDNAYVYVNIGYATSADDTSTYGDITKIEENISEDFSINESNYTKYSEYKYTFKKDSNNNYYFVSVEKN
ncbi:MAG: hypothetical protein Q4E39_01760 [bacterium]|nr:hypothetical protein [bacterium]